MKNIDINRLPQANTANEIASTRFIPFDVAAYLRSEEDMALYLSAAQEDGTEIDLAIAIQDIARARLNFQITPKP